MNIQFQRWLWVCADAVDVAAGLTDSLLDKVDGVVDVDGVRETLHEAKDVAKDVLDNADDVIDVAMDVVDVADDVVDAVDNIVDDIPAKGIVAFIKKILNKFGICGTN